MSLSQSSFNEYEYYITPSDMQEYLYCKRFIYFMKCLGISQYEEKRYKVLKGRQIHEQREKTNRDYLRKKINAVGKDINVSLASKELSLRGKVDEIIELGDGTWAPLDYKYTTFDNHLYKTHYIQMVMYALMIEESYGKIVNKGYIVFCRDGNLIKEFPVTLKAKQTIRKYINEFAEIICGYFPTGTRYKKRCLDCCYKNICVK